MNNLRKPFSRILQRLGRAIPFVLMALQSVAFAEDAPKSRGKAIDATVLFFDRFWLEVSRGRTHYLFIALIITIALLRLAKSGGVERVRGIVFIYICHLVMLPISGMLAASESSLFGYAQFLALLFAGLAGIFMAETLLFDLILPWIHVRAPRLLRDLVLAASSVVAAIYILAFIGAPLDKVFTTSAIVTAVIGFSLQDTLGNIMGGLSLTLDNSVSVGDWIKVNDPATPINGRVVMIRWRYTAVETRNWETIIVPNAVLMKGQVLVLGRRTAKPQQWRRWVYFNVDFRHAPSEVIGIVEKELRSAPIERVSADPQINCICMDLAESYARYAVRYWLTDLFTDDPTDSAVRCRIFYALKRAGIPLSIPAQALFTTRDDSAERRGEKQRMDLDKRRSALARVDLFNHMTDEERATLAAGLVYTPFTKSEVITKQGSVAHWLYIVNAGEVSIRVTNDSGLEREVAVVGAGHFFGEMSLMTGERRSATVVALSDVDCYRLDKDAFQSVISNRPELAEEIAGILAQRRIGLDAVKEGMSEDAKKKHIESIRDRMLDSIRDFFGLKDVGGGN